MNHSLPKHSPYGTWTSPVSASMVAEGSLRISHLHYANESLYWIEGRPQEQGRSVIVSSYQKGIKKDVLPRKYDIRTRVHEYGGLSYCVCDHCIYFVDLSSQNLYVMEPDRKPRKLVALEHWRFADFTMLPGSKYLYCIAEDHTYPTKVKNVLTQINVETGKLHVIAEGADFYAAPTLSPDGKKLAWITWNHPNMSWDASDLWLAEISSTGEVRQTQKIAGGEEISILHPMFSPQNILYYVSDQTGYWNIYQFYGQQSSTPVCPMDADVAAPLWVVGIKRAVFIHYRNALSLACIYTEQAIDRIGIINLTTGSLDRIDTPYTAISSLCTKGNELFFIGASPTIFSSVVSYNFEHGHTKVLFASYTSMINLEYFSTPIPLAYPTSNNETAYAFYYPPCHPSFHGDTHQSPPLLVKCHGGPTSHYQATLQLADQFWTSRGFGVLAVNYRGSSGYGRSYRSKLLGNWGIIDVDDAIYGAQYLVAQGKASASHIAITGGSAGGFTVLASLTFRKFFHAGASYYGVSDLEALVKETHKFEACYLEKLVGKYPDTLKRYRTLSPIHHVDQLSTPLIVLQGGKDRIVPPEQSISIYEALKKKGVPTEYLFFPEEAHGFRSAQSIRQALQAELAFYSKVFHLSNK